MFLIRYLPHCLIGAFGFFGFIFLFTGFPYGVGTGLVLLGLALIMFQYGLKEISASPPEKGLLTFWKRRFNIVLKEGYQLVADYFPLFLSFIAVKMEKVNQDFPVTFRCKAKDKKADSPGLADKTEYVAGPEVKMTTGMTYIPDDTNLINFIDYGQQKGVEGALQNILDKVWREEGSSLTIEELIASRDTLMTVIYNQIFADHIEVDALKDRIADLHKNGRSDAHNLGIKIMRINIANPEVVDADVRKAMEAQAKEEFQRRSEDFELETEMTQAQKLFDKYQAMGQGKSFESCLLEVRRRKSLREGRGTIIDIAGLGNFGGEGNNNIAQAIVAAAAVHGAAGSNQSTKATPATDSSNKGGKK